MPRFTLTQLLMGTALVAILLVFAQAEGCGRPLTLVECVSFSSDGSRIAVSKLNARDARTPLKVYKANVSRTISWMDSTTGASIGVIHQDFKPGNCGPAFRLWWVGRTSALCNPMTDRVSANGFGGGDITHYAGDESESTPYVTSLQHRALNMAFSDSGRLLAASGMYELTVLDTTNNAPVMRVQANELPFLGAALLAFSCDETRIAVASDAGVHIWDIATGTQVSTVLQGWQTRIYAVAMVPDDTLVICSDEWVRRYDFSGNVVSTLADSKDCYGCCVSSDGRNAAVIGDGNVLIYDLASNTKTNTIPFGSAIALAFSPDGHSLAIGDYYGKVSLFGVETGRSRWASSPPGRHRWPWTLPACFLAMWGFAAWRLSKRAETDGKRSRSACVQH